MRDGCATGFAAIGTIGRVVTKRGQADALLMYGVAQSAAIASAALLALSAVNWAYTWLTPGRDTDELADRFYALLVDGMRGYSTPA